jgi:hypothetical protein
MYNCNGNLISVNKFVCHVRKFVCIHPSNPLV